MLRFLVGLSLMSSAAAIAQPAAPEPTEAPVPVEVAEAPEAPEAPKTPQLTEAPKMKKVCRTYEVVGSAIPKTTCTMRPVKPSTSVN